MYILQTVLGVGLDIILLLYMLSRFEYKYSRWIIFTYCIAYMLIVITLNSIIGNSVFRIPIYCLLVWILIYAFYKDMTIVLSVKLLVAYFVIMQISETLILGIIFIMGNSNLYIDVMGGNAFKTILTILVTKISNMIIAVLFFRIINIKGKRYKYIHSIAILVPLFIALLALNINTIIILKMNSDESILGVMVTSSLIILLAMSYALFGEYCEKVREKENIIEILTLQNKQQYELYQEKRANDQKLRKMYHDIKSHTLYLSYCLEKKESAKGIEYANNILVQLESYKVLYNTNNGMLDCLLNDMRNKCDKEGIEFEVDIDFKKGCFMSDYDICTLFGNILDNAYEAVLKIPSKKDKPIKFKANAIENYYVAKVTNYMLSAKMIEINNYLTSKKDKENHGWGLKNIDDVLSKYKGVKKISIINDVFTVKIMVPIQNLSI